jgi:hypothetical protein
MGLKALFKWAAIGIVALGCIGLWLLEFHFEKEFAACVAGAVGSWKVGDLIH